MTFHEFLDACRDGSIKNDAAWRAYDIEGSVREPHVRSALKHLKMQYAGELAIPEFMARYGVATREEARRALGSYWIWLLIASGRGKPRIPLRAAQAG